MDMLEKGLGSGVLTAEVAKGPIGAGRIAILNNGATYRSQLALAWYPRPEMPHYFRALIQAIK